MSEIMEPTVTVVGEWLRTGPFERRQVWHLAKGRGDHDWQDVWCGGGIVHPAPRERVPSRLVCGACKTIKRRAALDGRESREARA